MPQPDFWKLGQKVFGSPEGMLKAQSEAKPLWEKYVKNRRNSAIWKALQKSRQRNYK